MKDNVRSILTKQQEYPKQLIDEDGVLFDFISRTECLGKKYGGYINGDKTETRLAEILGEGKARLLTRAESEAIHKEEVEIAKQEFLKKCTSSDGFVIS
ncbi:MAG: hypothetical protein LBL34_02840 [Clostridiales bacterium]|nr:hypothetical protein [Clostridiales bacterium]